MDDIISRQAVLECLDWYEHDRCEIDIYFREIVEDIKKLPSVQPEQKMGKWIKKMVRGREELYCSNCGDGIDVIYEYNYCPTCGAKMEEGE